MLNAMSCFCGQFEPTSLCNRIRPVIESLYNKENACQMEVGCGAVQDIDARLLVLASFTSVLIDHM